MLHQAVELGLTAAARPPWLRAASRWLRLGRCAWALLPRECCADCCCAVSMLGVGSIDGLRGGQQRVLQARRAARRAGKKRGVKCLTSRGDQGHLRAWATTSASVRLPVWKAQRAGNWGLLASCTACPIARLLQRLPSACHVLLVLRERLREQGHAGDPGVGGWRQRWQPLAALAGLAASGWTVVLCSNHPALLPASLQSAPLPAIPLPCCGQQEYVRLKITTR